MSELKYKVGDKVRIKSLDWYNANKDEFGEVRYEEYIFVKSMVSYCDSILTIETKTEDYYQVKENKFWWTDEMIEGLVEEEIDLIPKFGEYSDNEPLDIPTMTTDFVKEHGLPCPDGYQFKDENGNVINATKIVLEKKKKEHPKTYEECLKILGFTTIYTPKVEPMFDYDDDIIALQQLKNCRNAYWKIAGEEMALGKPWEPDWKAYDKKYVIGTHEDMIYQDTETRNNKILAFPTAEMRDAFYENFKKEIEICKELL